MMNDDRLRQKSGYLRRCGSDLVLMASDGLPWILDGDAPLAAHVGRQVTVQGYAYAECRFEVTGIAAQQEK